MTRPHGVALAPLPAPSLPVPGLPDVPLTPLSVAGLKRRLQPGARYHLAYRFGDTGPVSFRGDHLPGREVIKAQARQLHSKVIGGETIWLTFPVFKNGDALHATPDGFQFFLAGNGNTLRFVWGDAPEGVQVNRPGSAETPNQTASYQML